MTLHERAEQAAEQLYDDATILEIDGPWRERWTAIVEAALTAQFAELRARIEQKLELATAAESDDPLTWDGHTRGAVAAYNAVLALIDAQGAHG